MKLQILSNPKKKKKKKQQQTNKATKKHKNKFAMQRLFFKLRDSPTKPILS